MPQPNDLSRSLVALDQDSTIIAVVELSQSSWLVAGVLPGIERQPQKKLEPSAERLLGLLHRWRADCRLTIRGGGNRQLTWHRLPTERMGPPPGALPPMRMTASWSGSKRTYRIQVCGAKMRPMASSPRMIMTQSPELRKEKPITRSSSLRVLRGQ